MLNHRILLSQSYIKLYMVTRSTFYVEPLRVHLTGSSFKGFVDHYGFMEQINWNCSAVQALLKHGARAAWGKFLYQLACAATWPSQSFGSLLYITSR